MPFHLENHADYHKEKNNLQLIGQIISPILQRLIDLKKIQTPFPEPKFNPSANVLISVFIRGLLTIACQNRRHSLIAYGSEPREKGKTWWAYIIWM